MATPASVTRRQFVLAGAAAGGALVPGVALPRFSDGRVQQSNFHDFAPLRMDAARRVEVHLVSSSETPGGVGETGTACVAAALCDAIYAASGKRVRTLPVSRGLHG